MNRIAKPDPAVKPNSVQGDFPPAGTASKRLYDLAFSGIGLLVLSPVLALLALLVKFSDGGPVFYRQQRVGLGGRQFRIWKFRSMVVDADRLGIAVTRDGDPRITRVGRFLRKTKMDELPQLWNVFAGDMSLVGPRPEVPRYVERYTPEQRQILQLKPGITDLATLRFRNEEELLRAAEDTERFYIEHCIPRKIELNLEYARRAGIWADTLIILRTLLPWLDAKLDQRSGVGNH
jgi:lipopolysaccharide/colanic/teichoic acid biosynthesis glycosyltransferase